MKLFLDTNVLLDILMDSRPSHLESAVILGLGEKGAAQIVITTQSIVDAVYVFTQKEKALSTSKIDTSAPNPAHYGG